MYTFESFIESIIWNDLETMGEDLLWNSINWNRKRSRKKHQCFSTPRENNFYSLGGSTTQWGFTFIRCIHFNVRSYLMIFTFVLSIIWSDIVTTGEVLLWNSINWNRERSGEKHQCFSTPSENNFSSPGEVEDNEDSLKDVYIWMLGHICW